MNQDEFVRLVGERIWHITLVENRASILRSGLVRPATLAELVPGLEAQLVLRREDVLIRTGSFHARLNHQKPLRAGRGSAFLDDCSLEDWSRQLDARLFFWPARKGAAFLNSLNNRGSQWRVEFDSRLFFEKYKRWIDLAPINTGNATRRPSPRGNWIYVPVTESAESFRTNRLSRGVAHSRDSVEEISLRRDIPPADLAAFGIFGGIQEN